jgi:membrane protease YdiL (CAAX protease family)
MQENKPLTHVTAGLMIAAALVVYSIIINLAGLSEDKTFGFITYAILIVGLVVVIGIHAKANNYRLSFGNLFAFGFKSTAVFTVVFIIFIVIFNLIFPELKEKGFEMARTQLEDQGKMSDEQIDQALEMGKKFFWVGVVGGTMLMFIILGAIGSLIGAAVTKKNQVNPLDEYSA